MKAPSLAFAVAAGLLAATGVAVAQTSTPAAPAAVSPAPASPTGQAPTSLSVYFETGSASVRPQDEATLDEASRIFNDGKPIVMIITGMADASGSAGPNLLLSQKRADVVFQGLVARGLPPNHFQILAAGDSDSLTGQEPPGANQAFRKVEITWR